MTTKRIGVKSFVAVPTQVERSPGSYHVYIYGADDHVYLFTPSYVDDSQLEWLNKNIESREIRIWKTVSHRTLRKCLTQLRNATPEPLKSTINMESALAGSRTIMEITSPTMSRTGKGVWQTLVKIVPPPKKEDLFEYLLSAR